MFDAVKSRWSIVYMWGSHVIIFKIYHISFSALAKISYPDEKPHYLDLYCLQEYPGTQRIKIWLFLCIYFHTENDNNSCQKVYIENTR